MKTIIGTVAIFVCGLGLSAHAKDQNRCERLAGERALKEFGPGAQLALNSWMSGGVDPSGAIVIGVFSDDYKSPTNDAGFVHVVVPYHGFDGDACELDGYAYLDPSNSNG